MNQSKKVYRLILSTVVFIIANTVYAKGDVAQLVSKEEFISYQDVAEFIDHSPKVTIVVPAQQSDVDEYGRGVVKTLTGSDCDRDGKMDDNPTCNAVYYKLWLKYRLNNKDKK